MFSAGQIYTVNSNGETKMHDDGNTIFITDVTYGKNTITISAYEEQMKKHFTFSPESKFSGWLVPYGIIPIEED
jgi:hypothetical protein